MAQGSAERRTSRSARGIPFFIAVCCAAVCCTATADPVSAQQIDHSRFDMLLGMYVDHDGMVDYEGFRSFAFDRYFAALASASLDSMQENERLAFLLNAYNACVIRGVLEHLPIGSVREVEDFFSVERWLIAGRQLSLDELEKRHIVPLAPVMSLFGICKGAKGSPKLLRRVYRGETVRQQLKTNAQVFMRDPTKNYVNRQAGELTLSLLIKQRRSAFDLVFGSIRQFAMQYVSEEDALWMSYNRTVISYHAFDWTLNSQ